MAREKDRKHSQGIDFAPEQDRSRFVYGFIWLFVFVGTLFVGAPWAGYHGILFACLGVTIFLFPPQESIPRSWLILGGLFMVGASFVFLPADFLPAQEWRENLEKAGIDTGSQIVIQSQMALESLAIFVMILFAGFWMAGHRASPEKLRVWSLVFTAGVAFYAITSWILREFSDSVTGSADYGFFPNRNHTACYLAMGAICGLGCVLQSIRDKRVVRTAISLATTGICLWSAAAWSTSRAGILLVAIGGTVWLFLLGKHYLGKHGLWAVGLLYAAALGLFMIADSTVKQRISETIEKTYLLAETAGDSSSLSEQETISGVDLDFRVPTAIDTVGMIADNRWTGVGAGQFNYIFPQYKHLTSVNNGNDSYHPESDWLWMASEVGVPATVFLALLVLLAFAKSLKAIFRARDRALRSACLLAAAVVPFHGIFDVPGHRIALAFACLFLYSLSLPLSRAGDASAFASKLGFRVFALIALVFGGLLISAQWANRPVFATIAASNALLDSKKLFLEDKALQDAATAQDQEYQPDPSEDKLERALKILDHASRKAPLDRQVPRYRAFIAFHFDDKFDVIDEGFTFERALDPTWVAGPYRQGVSWVASDEARVVALWEEALNRAGSLQKLDPANRWNIKSTMEMMEKQSKGRPQLESFVKDADGTDNR